MRLVFIYYLKEDRGSAQDLMSYVKAARKLGHEVSVYGRGGGISPFDCSQRIEKSDAAIFIFEWTTELSDGRALDYVRLVSKIPRNRRVVIDCDGRYNAMIDIRKDFNHSDSAEAQTWMYLCDSLTDKILQSTFEPKRNNVRPFLFHAYDPSWEKPLDYRNKNYGMVYVGNNWFRWHLLNGVLQAVKPIVDRVGRIAIVGHGWDGPAPWAGPEVRTEAYYFEPAYLRSLGVEVFPPIPFTQVVDWMSKGLINPVIYRPLFTHLKLVTCRSYETFSANTIPLFPEHEGTLIDLYGDAAAELVMADDPTGKIEDVLSRPRHYAGIVAHIRAHLAENHCHAARLKELLRIVES